MTEMERNKMDCLIEILFEHLKNKKPLHLSVIYKQNEASI